MSDVEKKRRFRTPKAKPGQLLSKYGQEYGERDLFHCWNGERMKPDSRLVMHAIDSNPIYEGRSLRQELELRGYDITTMRFSISRLPQQEHKSND